MGLRLRIENETNLPDGGPLDISISGRRGIDIGRDPHLDWTLPDASRQISGKHCEVRFVDGEYVLYDVSTNGTFVNGSDRRMQGPHMLKSGDRILIGNYIISADIGGEARPAIAARTSLSPRGGGDDIWSGSEEAAPPGRRSDFVQRSEKSYAKADFLDWAADLPTVDDASGASHLSKPVQEAELRAVWIDSEPTGAWALSKPARMESVPANESLKPDSAREAVAASEVQRARMPPASDPWPEDGPAAELPQDAPAPRASIDVQQVARAPAIVSEAPSGLAAPTLSRSDPSGMTAVEALSRFALAAGAPPDALLRRDVGETLDDLGTTTRVAVESMMRLLAARSGAKREIRSSEYTTVGAQDNNPLKFAPNAEDAIAILFGPPMRSYLGGSAAFAKGFEDIASHQVRVFAAMQQAVRMLLADLDPAMIEQSANLEKGAVGLFGSHKARLWDQYLSIWNIKAAVREDGLAGLFMEYFSVCYDKLGAAKSSGSPARRRPETLT